MALIPTHRILCALILIYPTKALSSIKPGIVQQPQKGQWSQEVIANAKNFGKLHKDKLVEAGATEIQWPIYIRGELITETTPPEKMMRDTINDDGETDTVTKIIHFQRHGEGYHNLLGTVYREHGRTFDIDDKDPTVNPFLRPSITDSPLTQQGCDEGEARRLQASLLNPEVVIVSPLQRAVQTALISFQDHYEKGVPFVAEEGCREQLGLLICNKRMPLSQAKARFPQVDFSLVDGEEDSLWEPDEREPPIDEAHRVYKFMTEFIMKRPEKELAIVGHSAWLSNLGHCVMDCDGDDNLESLYLTSEIRSVRVTFTKK